MPCTNWKPIAAVLAVCPLALVVGMAVLGRSGNRGKDTSEIDDLRAEVARLRGDVPAGEGRP